MPDFDRPRICVLYFDDCPHWQETVERVRGVAAQYGLGHAVESVRVESQDDARRMRFLGSPTVQVNGIDIDPAASDGQSPQLACRWYGSSGVPSVEMIEAAIADAAT